MACDLRTCFGVCDSSEPAVRCVLHLCFDDPFGSLTGCGWRLFCVTVWMLLQMAKDGERWRSVLAMPPARKAFDLVGLWTVVCW